MYVCMYACMYVCMYACMYACMHACIRVYSGCWLLKALGHSPGGLPSRQPTQGGELSMGETGLMLVTKFGLRRRLGRSLLWFRVSGCLDG